MAHGKGTACDWNSGTWGVGYETWGVKREDVKREEEKPKDVKRKAMFDRPRCARFHLRFHVSRLHASRFTFDSLFQ
jgi:hypothetical protein